MLEEVLNNMNFPLNVSNLILLWSRLDLLNLTLKEYKIQREKMVELDIFDSKDLEDIDKKITEIEKNIKDIDKKN
jgi:coenzyme F420-reducing hydrogenase delta subunit